MSSTRLRIVGIDKVKRNFDALVTGIDPVAVLVLKEVAKEVKDEAKELVAVDTGALQASIRLIVTAATSGRVTRVGVRAGGYEVNPKTGKLVNYAIPQEFGTSRMAPHPYLIPAASKKAGPIMRRLLKEISEITRRFG